MFMSHDVWCRNPLQTTEKAVLRKAIIAVVKHEQTNISAKLHSAAVNPQTDREERKLRLTYGSNRRARPHLVIHIHIFKMCISKMQPLSNVSHAAPTPAHEQLDVWESVGKTSASTLALEHTISSKQHR